MNDAHNNSDEVPHPYYPHDESPLGVGRWSWEDTTQTDMEYWQRLSNLKNEGELEPTEDEQ